MFRRLPTMPKLVKRGLLLGSGIYLYKHSTFNPDTSEYKFENSKGLQVLASPNGFYIQRAYFSWLPPIPFMSIDENGLYAAAKFRNSMYVATLDSEGLNTAKITMDPELYRLYKDIKKSFKNNDNYEATYEAEKPNLTMLKETPLTVTICAPENANVTVKNAGLFSKTIKVEAVNEKYLFGLLPYSTVKEEEITVPIYKQVVRK